MVYRMPSEGKRDTPGKGGETDTLRPFPSVGHISYYARSMRGAGGRHARDRVVNSDQEEEDRPPN